MINSSFGKLYTKSTNTKAGIVTSFGKLYPNLSFISDESELWHGIRVKTSGIWKNVTGVKVKQTTTWKAAKVFRKISGNWELVHESEF